LKHGAAMRFVTITAIFALVAGCDRIPDDSRMAGVYPGTGRDALCLTAVLGDAKLRADAIAYGQGDTNCSLRGTATIEGDRLIIEPMGDSECRIVASREAGSFVLPAQLPGACAYYCGPSATLANKRFTFNADAPHPKDIAGDPIC
jgi:hypothetical protein